MADIEIAKEGLERMKSWMEEIGLVMHISELGVKENMFDKIINGTFISDTGYKILSPNEIKDILKASM